MEHATVRSRKRRILPILVILLLLLLFGCICSNESEDTETKTETDTKESSWSLGRTGDDNALNAVYSPGAGEAWFVGDAGSIYHTTDSGKTVEKKDSGTTEDLDAIWFIDETTGFAAGSNGAFVKTEDGGKTWVAVDLPVPCMSTVRFADSNVGYAAGNFGALYRTEDGGKTWVQQAAGITEGWITSVAVVDASKAYFTTDDGLYATTDGGKTWTKVVDAIAPPTDVAVGDDGYVWLVGKGYIYRSSNGKDFEIVEVAPPVDWSAVVTNSAVYAGGDAGAFYQSTDQGDTWEQEDVGTEQDITGMDHNEDGETWATFGGTEEMPEPSSWADDDIYQFGMRAEF